MTSQPPPPWQPPQPWMNPTPQLPRPQPGLVDPQDVRASLEARRELGPDMEQALVDSFVARVEDAIAQRGSTDTAERERRTAATTADSRNQMVLGIGSLIFAIPLTAIAVGQAGIIGMIVTWLAIIMVNLAYALRKGPRNQER